MPRVFDKVVEANAGEHDDNCQAYSLLVGEHKSYAVLFRVGKHDPTHQQVHHEVFHIAQAIMADIGEPASWQTEAAAYLGDYLVGWVYNRLDKGGITVHVSPTKVFRKNERSQS